MNRSEEPLSPVAPERTTRPKAQGGEVAIGRKVVVVTSPDEMTSYIPDWDDLADHAAEPNLFYESWALLPAWKHLADATDIRIVLVFSHDKAHSTAQPLLLGLFPIAAHVRHQTIRVATAFVWRHTHCPLATPLLRKGYEREALAGLFNWIESNRNLGHMLSFELVGGDGPFFESLQSLVYDEKRLMFSYNEFSRGVFRPMADVETYLQKVLSAKRRRNLRQEYNNLSKLGRLETLELKPGDNLDYWVRSFFDLEGAGWKGQTGSAIVCKPTDVQFFQELSNNAHAKQKLQILMLCLDDRPIAMQYNLVSPQGAFALKIAFDENYRRYSPGMLLGIEAFRLFHGHPDVPWMDSCPSAPVNITRENLWNESRLIRHILVSTGDIVGKTILRILPTARTVKRALRPKTKPGS